MIVIIIAKKLFQCLQWSNICCRKDLHQILAGSLKLAYHDDRIRGYEEMYIMFGGLEKNDGTDDTDILKVKKFN